MKTANQIKMAELNSNWVNNINTMGANAIWNEIVYDVPYCVALKTSCMTRGNCVKVIRAAKHSTAFSGGYTNLIIVAIPEPIVYYSQSGKKLWATSFTPNGVSMSDCEKPVNYAGITYDLDELPLYVLRQLCEQIIQGKIS